MNVVCNWVCIVRLAAIRLDPLLPLSMPGISSTPIATNICAVRRTFKALQLANYLFNPSLDIIQALLILGNTLQNLGQSEGAWVLLGTTVRLAQALGLHMESVRQKPGEIGRKVRAVWYVHCTSTLCRFLLCHKIYPKVTHHS